MNNNEFYIGWEEKAPDSYRKLSRRFVYLAGGICLLWLCAWVVGQKGFADSTFELGTLSELEGIMTMQPAPMLKVDHNGASHSVILIGFGKKGAESTLQAIQEKQQQILAGKNIRLRGTLIYHNGKTLLELTQGENAFVGWGSSTIPAVKPDKELGMQSLVGEILDPKCALGVMKPGYGKPHRSCAVRCLSGGIPAVMRIKNKAGQENYCLVVGPEGEPVNQSLLPFVADQVRICGNLRLEDDWLVLYTDPEADIIRLKPFWAADDMPMCN